VKCVGGMGESRGRSFGGKGGGSQRPCEIFFPLKHKAQAPDLDWLFGGFNRLSPPPFSTYTSIQQHLFMRMIQHLSGLLIQKIYSILHCLLYMSDEKKACF
jgi:hypothetical protein